MPTRIRFAIPVLALALAIAACGDDDDNPAATNPDTTPPSVSGALAIDVSHIEVTFDENLQRTSAEDAGHYTIVEATPLASAASAPGDTLVIDVVALKSDQRTVSITTSMGAAPYDITIAGVKDASGNVIETPVVASFDGTADADVTPPEIALRSPGPNATNVATGAPLEITFSERVFFPTVTNGTTWTWASGAVDFDGSTSDLAHCALRPTSPLLPATRYTVTMTGVEDWEDNVMPDVTWSFTTSGMPDVTPPTIASSVPADLATHVDVNTDISITFSEPMDQTIAMEWEIFPYVDAESPFDPWTDGGRTFLIETNEPLADDQQYMVLFYQGHARDLAGNRLVQSSIHFTTGSFLARGSIAGRVLGDSESDTAQDPGGAVLFATTDFFEPSGAAVAAENGTFDIRHLPDGDHYIFAYLESNGDPDNLDPYYGDAFGVFGVDVRGGDLFEEVVTIVGGGRVTGRNFELYDVSAITGYVAYEGSDAGAHEVGVGLFDTYQFDPESPDYTADAYWPDFPEFAFASYFNGPISGTYYAGAFLDVNDNLLYDPGVDPVGFYGGETYNEITIENGSDWNGIVILMEDPVPGATAAVSPASSWAIKPAKRNDLVAKLTAAMRERARVAK